MKKILLSLVMIVLSGLIFSSQSLAARFKQHQVRQQKRIWQGIHTGQLNRHEARGLRYEQRRIHRLKKSFWHDGRLTKKERHHLRRWQRKADRHIWRLKHNSHHRNWNWRRPHRYGHRHPWHIW